MKQELTYELIVIGGGPAGGTAARVAARAGRRVALIEQDKLGGTCLNYGCDPTKALVHAAGLLHNARTAKPYGIEARDLRVNWHQAISRVNKIINKFRGGTHEDAVARQTGRGIDVYLGHARFLSASQIQVADTRLQADRIIIATGATTAVPPIPGLARSGYITNVEAVTLEPLPKQIAILGGGTLGIEFAQIFSRFGSKVTVFERGPRILMTEDERLTMRLHKLLVKEGIAIEVGAHVEGVELLASKQKLVKWQKAATSGALAVDALLVATGRRPNIDSLDLERAGVRTYSRGIVVDETLHTSVPHIWAAGDVTGMYPFTHVASPQGVLAATNAFSDKPESFNYNAVPWVVYTSPPLARVGKTQAQLDHDGVKYRVTELPVRKIPRSIITGNTAGLIRIITDPQGIILGAHILGDGADEWIAPVIVAMRAGLPIQQLANTIFPYPTVVQGIGFTAARFRR